MRPISWVYVVLGLVAIFAASPAIAPAAAAPTVMLTRATAPAVAVPLSTPDSSPNYLDAVPGDMLRVRLEQLAPTQPTIGYDQVYYKLGRYRVDPKKKFDDYCEDNGQGGVKDYDAATSRLSDPASYRCKRAPPRPVEAAARRLKTVVIGPGGKLYLTDGHHTTSILQALPDGGPGLPIWVRVTDNLSALAPAAFWRRMVDQQKAWLRTPEGKAIQPEQLPAHIGLDALGDDPYRSLVYFARDIGYAPPADATEFLEFYWASWLRTRAGLALSRYRLDDVAAYRRAVGDAARLMVALPADADVWEGKTAAALGRLDQFDPQGELEKLGRDGRNGKQSGRLVYAVRTRAALPR